MLQFPKHTLLFCQPVIPMGFPLLFIPGPSSSSNCLENPHLLFRAKRQYHLQEALLPEFLLFCISMYSSCCRHPPGVSFTFLPYLTWSSLRTGMISDLCLQQAPQHSSQHPGNFSELELKSSWPLPYAHTPLTTVCIQILQFSRNVVVAHHLYTPEFLLGNRLDMLR